LLGLSLNQTQIDDLAPLAGMSALAELWLTGTRVSDLAPLAGLTALQELWLDRTLVSDLAPLAGLSRLRILRLSQTLASDLAPLARLTKLEELWLNETPALKVNAELARLGNVEDEGQLAMQTLAYVKSLPPWPEPLPWLQADDRTDNTRHKPPLSPSAVPGRGLVPPAGLKRLSVADARLLLQSGHPVLRDRCQRVVAEIDDALAMLAVRIPNEPERLAEHNALTRTLTLAKAAMVDIHEAIPETLTDQPITDAEAGRLRAAFDTAIERLKTAAAYVDRKDHTPTYGGLLKLGTATGVASVLAMVPGVNLVLAIPAVYACLYGADAAKALKIGAPGGS
jgi:hypothetical protein